VASDRRSACSILVVTNALCGTISTPTYPSFGGCRRGPERYIASARRRGVSLEVTSQPNLCARV
jgi:hypothetical protein